jgi:formylglycine-generating enzyme required for sulfatase activity
MSGNVFEWRQDWFANDYYKNSPSIIPYNYSTSNEKVSRGGFWLSNM